MTSSDDTNDILDMLFDVDDPVLSGGFSPLLKQEELDLLKDFEFMMQQPNHVESAENEFWKTFMKTDDNFSSVNPQNIAVPNFGDSFSDQSSPPSHSDSYSPGAPSVCSEQSECNSDGSDSHNKYDGTTMMNFIHDYSSMSKMPNAEDGIEIGADVVVMTSQDNTKWEINTDDYKTNVKREQEHTTSEDDDMCTVDFSIGAEKGPPVLKLTAEEKRLFRKEGLQIPTHLPLTKAEERELKRIRRKIRNKQSAQDSRKRKKEYVEGLESRVKLCSAQNIQLQKRVEMLEKQNMSLLNQLKRLQSLVSSSATKPVQTSTCVMVLLLSFVLLLIPSWAPSSMNKGLSFSANHNNNPDKSPPIPGHSRTLLHKTDIMANDIAKTEIMSNDLTGMAENENLSLPVEKKSDYVDLTSEVYEEEIETMQEDVLPSSYTTEIIDKIEPGKPDLALPSNFSGSKVFVRPVEERVVVKWVHEA